MGHILTPTEWGWQDHDQSIVPMATNQPAAPLQLMNIVTCGVGLVLVMHVAAGKQEWCATICFNCMGVSCDNAPEMDLDNQ